MYPYYVDVITDWENEATLVDQRCWLVENGVNNVYHAKTHNPLWGKQFNRWRFNNETDAMAFKLRWAG